MVFTLYVLVVGLALGSFLYTTAIRLIHNRSLWKRSACLNCQTPVSVIGLIPVIGFILLGGKCRHCKIPIPYPYPLAELINATIVYLVYEKTGINWQFLYYIVIFELLFLIALIDLKSYLIQVQPLILILVIQTGWLLLIDPHSLVSSLIGLFAGTGFFIWVSYLYQVIRKKNGLGDGDALLLGAIGFIGGWRILFPTVFWGSLFGIFGGALVLAIRKQKMNQIIAFGPWLILGGYLSWLYPQWFQKYPLHLFY